MALFTTPLVRNAPEETVAGPIRERAIRIVEGLGDLAAARGLTREAVEAALAFYLFNPETWGGFIDVRITTDTARIWSNAKPGSHLLLRAGQEHLLVEETTCLQRLIGELHVSQDYFIQEGDSPQWKCSTSRGGPDLVADSPYNLSWKFGASSYTRYAQDNVRQSGIDHPDNIGLFIPAPGMNVTSVSRWF